MKIFNRLFAIRHNKIAKTRAMHKLDTLRAMSPADLADFGAKPADVERILLKSRM
jgi:hypothetical protein